MSEIKRKETVKRIAFIGIFLIMIIGLTYAWLSITLNGTRDNVLKAGTLSLVLDDTTSSGINLSNSVPVTDKNGLSTTAYTFTLTNNGNFDSDFTIYLDDVALENEESRMDDYYVKYNLTRDVGSINKTGLIFSIGSNPNRILNKGTIKVGETYSYTLRIWIDSNATNEAMGKVFSTKLRVEAIQDIGNEPNPPELVGDMIPVVYDQTSSNWVKANPDDWYNYDNQEWANAVTVTATNRGLVSSPIGTVIPMNFINAMFVWIPRYSYTIGNTYGVQGYGGDSTSMPTPGAINIKFVNSGTTDTGSAAYKGRSPSEYYTSPAFCFGDTCDTSRSDSSNKELSGLWVGKFEISAANTISNAVQVPIIKPNVISWRNAQVATFFTSIQDNMNGSNGTTNYGFSGTNYDAHMMKNTEWGAVAYLSQSRYGKYGNTNYIGANKEVYNNDSSSYYTGRSQGVAPATSNSTAAGTYQYNVEGAGTGASTTGNITGIYDMSGGANEHVMGNMMISGNTEPQVGFTLGVGQSQLQSGFIGKVRMNNGGYTDGIGTITYPAKKYVNQYNYGTFFDYTRAITGDATTEVKYWYHNTTSFVNANGSFFDRGGVYSDGDPGIFNFTNSHGIALNSHSSRVVLTT